MILETLKNCSILTFLDIILFDMKNDFQKGFIIVPSKFNITFTGLPPGRTAYKIDSKIRKDFIEFSEKLIRKFAE